jgi:hypothetical protein
MMHMANLFAERGPYHANRKAFGTKIADDIRREIDITRAHLEQEVRVKHEAEAREAANCRIEEERLAEARKAEEAARRAEEERLAEIQQLADIPILTEEQVRVRLRQLDRGEALAPLR